MQLGCMGPLKRWGPGQIAPVASPHPHPLSVALAGLEFVRRINFFFKLPPLSFPFDYFLFLVIQLVNKVIQKDKSIVGFPT